MRKKGRPEPGNTVPPVDIHPLMELSNTSKATFRTFNGVFRPTLLTILGVMMYLRQGWLVGNAGLLGAALVILFCFFITGTTALSISSITTNIRVGSGGVFSIISQSLGLEVGGSVGIPLYLAQGLSAALYIRGIVETWHSIFPAHPEWSVMLVLVMLVVLLSYFSSKLAFKVQSLVMLGLILALVSMFLGAQSHPINSSPVLWGKFEDGSLAVLFAVFFPAATGIMVGSSMSGDLTNPRRSIPVGTLAAWGTALLVYLSLAVWYAFMGDSTTLRNTETLFSVNHAFYSPLVLVGIMSSCFSAALSSMVAAPRVLSALAQFQIVPLHSLFNTEHRGEPRNATLFTGLLVLIVLVLADLNTIAKILTMFFLLIYFMINLVLCIEQRLKLISFRPLFPISRWVPVLGTISSFIAILVISPITGLLAIAFILFIYAYLDHKQLRTPWETVHSGILGNIANWAAKKVFLTEHQSMKRTWKPDLLIPVERSTQLEGYFRPIYSLTYPQGSIQIAGFLNPHDQEERGRIKALVNDLQAENLFATSCTVEAQDFIGGLRTCISVMKGSFFNPNTIFTSIDNRSQDELQAIVDMAQQNQFGVIFLAYHPESRMGRERQINLWIRDQSPNWQLGLELANLDYAVLMCYQLKKNWKAKVRSLCLVNNPEHLEQAKQFISKLFEYARMPKDIEMLVQTGQFNKFIESTPRADLNIFGLADKVDKSLMEKMVQQTKSSCLFVMDSGNESALA